MAAALVAPALADVPQARYKVAYYNIQSGKGEQPLPGRTAPFTENTNCTDPSKPLNAWGVGFIQQHLEAAIGQDSSVIALGLGEAWASTCGSPANVRKALGWAAHSGERNGVAMVVRYGFAGAVQWQQLDTSLNENPSDTKWVVYAPVCVDAACSASVDVFITHWYASGSSFETTFARQGQQTVAFMQALAGSRPHAVLGDFNAWEAASSVCGQTPKGSNGLNVLRSAGYVDAWPAVNGTAEGATGMTNRRGCGTPEGWTWKRIDYAWSRDLHPISMTRFGAVTAGDGAPSDHFGIIAEYSLAGTPQADTTAPTAAVLEPAEGALASGTARVTATASDDTNVARVELVVDGSVIATDDAAPYEFAWDTTAVSDGGHMLQARAWDAAGNYADSAFRTVTVANQVTTPSAGSTLPSDDSTSSSDRSAQDMWTNPVNVTVNGATITKTSGCNGCADAGAVSAREVTSSGGHVEFVPTLGGRMFAGLGPDRSASTAASAIAFGFSFWPAGTWDVRESGVYRTEGKFAQGDVFRVAVEGGAVVYYRNGTPVYTSKVSPSFPLGLDTTLLSSNASIANATVNGVTTTPQEPAPTPSPADSASPMVYDAPADRVARQEPAVPVLGGPGFAFADPTFGSRLLRVTDGRTRPGAADRSYRTPSAGHQNAWNTAASYFYVVSTDGTVVPFAFDAATFSATRIAPSTSGDGGLVLDFRGEPQFSFVHANLIYGAHRSGTYRTIQQYDFSTRKYSLLLDLDTLSPDLAGTYVGGISSSSGAVERIAAFYGGASQDRHTRVVVFDRDAPSRRRVIDTAASTIDGAPTAITLNFKLHHAFIDRTGRYVLLSPTGADRQAPRYAAAHYLWEIETGAITPLPAVAARAGGHNTVGFASMVNQDCCTSTTWDAAQWQYRDFSAPLVTRDVVTPVLLPKEVYLGEHTSWNNARADALVPFFASTYRYGNNTTEWRAWDDEIVAVQAAPAAGGTTIWRFAHHRSNTASEADPTRIDFWYTPRVNAAPNGRFAIFTSNWEKTLGIDAGVTSTSQYRQDVFVVELQSTGTPPPPPAALDITTLSLQDGVRGTAYGGSLTASGGVAPYAWSLTGGSLPPGLALAPAGTIAGTPTDAGTWTFQVTASDSQATPARDAATLSITIALPPNQAPTASFLTPVTDAVVTTGIAVALAVAPQDTDGTIARVEFSANGASIGSVTAAPFTMTWVPSSAGRHTLSALAVDDRGATAAASVAVSAVGPVQIETASLPNGVRGAVYAQQLSATGGLGSYTWSVASGTLAPGLALSASGQLAGTPSQAGSWTFTLAAQDAADASRKATRTYTQTVDLPPNQLPKVSFSTPADAAVVTAGAAVALSTVPQDADGTIVRVTFAVNGVTVGSVSAAPFAMAWTPAASGAYTVTATAVDDREGTARAALEIRVVNPVQITTASLPNGVRGAGYSQQLSATGGLGSYTWSVASGTLAPGIALSTSGQLAGTPTQAGSWTFTLAAQDAADASRKATRTYTLTVELPPNRLPTISVAAPAQDALISVSAPVTLSAAASDTDGTVVRVEFRANGTLVGSATAAPFELRWAAPAAGAHSLTATAIDDRNGRVTSAPVNVTAVQDVVLYASDATAVVGNFGLSADPSAAGGMVAWNRNRNEKKVGTPATAPRNYVEFTFRAEAGRPYHLWIRGRAEKDSWANDSAYVQFSGTVDAAGSPLYRIGTTQATAFIVEDGVNAGLSGWGWQDNEYGAMGADLYFATTGLQTIRIQQREDGVQIDQIVISAARYLREAPGTAKGDGTIVKK